MKISFNGRKCLALIFGPISAFVLAGSFNSTFALADPYVPQTSAPIKEFGLEGEIPVPPWCAWHSSIQENVVLAPADDPSGAITYRGDAINLAFSSDWNYTYVGGETGITQKPVAENCSWFGDPAYGSQLAVEITRNNFVANIVDGSSLIPDNAMDFDLVGLYDFKLTRNLDTTCDDSGNSFSTPALISGLTRQPAHVAIYLTSVSAASTLTNNFCKWKADYALTLPGGLEPTYTRADYVWVGPQLIYTLSFSA